MVATVPLHEQCIGRRAECGVADVYNILRNDYVP
jgi:hypothetical protein